MFKARIVKIFAFRRMLWDMGLKQFKARYAGSYLGIWWALVTPLLLAVSINFVFAVVFKMTKDNYALFVLSGILPWTFFTGALEESTSSFVHYSATLKQGIFPREYIPLAPVLSHMLNFLVGLVFLLPVFIFFNIRVAALVPLLLIIIPLQVIFISGLGFFCSYLNMFFRDLGHILATVFMALFWVTPIFYSLDLLPPGIRLACLSNPMSHFVMLYQDILFFAKLPSLWEVVFIAGVSLLVFLFGYLGFVRHESELLKRV